MSTPDHPVGGPEPADEDDAFLEELAEAQMIAPTLRRVIPLNESIPLDGAAGVRLVLVALAIYDTATHLHVMVIAPETRVEARHGLERSTRGAGHFLWRATDDAGTDYGPAGASGGGGSAYWTMSVEWRTGVPDEATALAVIPAGELGGAPFAIDLGPGEVQVLRTGT